VPAVLFAKSFGSRQSLISLHMCRPSRPWHQRRHTSALGRVESRASHRHRCSFLAFHRHTAVVLMHVIESIRLGFGSPQFPIMLLCLPVPIQHWQDGGLYRL
jgi:hypothetical protein